jgi:protocatechuate 3,4-dioxygenase beta subunit
MVTALKLLVAAALLPLVIVGVLSGQTRSVEGTVTGEDGKPVAGAVVRLENPVTLQIRSYITTEKGRYQFHRLEPDITYELTVTHEQYQPESETVSKFDSSTRVTVNFQLSKS